MAGPCLLRWIQAQLAEATGRSLNFGNLEVGLQIYRRLLLRR